LASFELAIRVPVPALVGATANMRDRIDKAAIDQRQTIGAEGRGMGVP